jgi:hypothetical protein
MQAHEEIVWVGETQYGSRGWAGGILVILFGGFFLAMGLLASTLIMAAFGLLFMIVGIPLTYQGFKQGGTRFYLTNFRLVRAKKESIISQFSRQIFRGKNLSSFLRVTAPPKRDAKDRAWSLVETFLVQILDPSSGNLLMSLGWVPEPSVKALETISQVVYCQYCGRKNDSSSNVCAECGANL